MFNSFYLLKIVVNLSFKFLYIHKKILKTISNFDSYVIIKKGGIHMYRNSVLYSVHTIGSVEKDNDETLCGA